MWAGEGGHRAAGVLGGLGAESERGVQVIFGEVAASPRPRRGDSTQTTGTGSVPKKRGPDPPQGAGQAPARGGAGSARSGAGSARSGIELSYKIKIVAGFPTALNIIRELS